MHALCCDLYVSLTLSFTVYSSNCYFICWKTQTWALLLCAHVICRMQPAVPALYQICDRVNVVVFYFLFLKPSFCYCLPLTWLHFTLCRWISFTISYLPANAFLSIWTAICHHTPPSFSLNSHFIWILHKNYHSGISVPLSLLCFFHSIFPCNAIYTSTSICCAWFVVDLHYLLYSHWYSDSDVE